MRAGSPGPIPPGAFGRSERPRSRRAERRTERSRRRRCPSFASAKQGRIPGSSAPRSAGRTFRTRRRSVSSSVTRQRRPPPPAVCPENRCYTHPSLATAESWVSDRGWDDLTDEEFAAARAAYAACVEYLDEIVGDLLGTLASDGALDDTIVVYTSDHGELAGEHGLWFKWSWHEASTRVPLVIQTPAQRRGASPDRITTPVSLTDLFPTLGGLADVPIPSDLDGHDVSAAIESGSEPDRGPVVCDNPAGPYAADKDLGYRLVRDGRWKYVAFRDAPDLLFDLETDPHETENLADDPPPWAGEPLARFREFVATTYDFEELSAERQRDAARCETHRMDTPPACDVPGGVNAFHLPDGRVVRADNALYDPEVIGQDPGAFASDWTGADGGVDGTNH